jgi:hypothetical protein
MRQIMNGQIPVDAAKSRERAAEFNVESGCRKWTEMIDEIL